MAVFVYRGIRVATGKQVKGVRDADSPKVLRMMLKRDGVLLTSATEDKKAGKSGGSAFGSLFQGISQDDIVLLTRQLATLVTAGIPLVEAVSAMVEQADKLELKRVLTQVRDSLNEGSTFAKALEAHPKAFPVLYINMVAAGEASGTLEKVLERLADFMENQSKLKGKVMAAMAYPAFMTLFGGLLVSVMMVTVVPKVATIFESLDRALPWYTSALIWFSNVLSSSVTVGILLGSASLFCVLKAISKPPEGPAKTKGEKKAESLKDKDIRNPGWTVASAALIIAKVLIVASVESRGVLAIGLVIGWILALVSDQGRRYLETPKGKLRLDTFMLALPIMGDLLLKLAVARFARTLGTLLRAGVPLLKAMDIVKNVLDNAKLSKTVEDATGSIREGESIATPLKKSKVFPPLVTHMIAVGEKSGQLEEMLENVARNYDTQVESKVQAMTSLLEPVMIVVMGGGVGFIAFAILMPLMQMNDFGSK